MILTFIVPAVSYLQRVCGFCLFFSVMIYERLQLQVHLLSVCRIEVLTFCAGL